MKVKKVVSVLLSLVLCAGLLPQLPHQYTGSIQPEAASLTKSIGVDINDGSDPRESVRSKTFYDWSLVKAGELAPSFKVEGITFTLKGSGSNGDVNIFPEVNRNLVENSGESPVLTMDGAKLQGVFRQGTLTLEISGLEAGTHSITTWHNFFSTTSTTNTRMNVSINGTVVDEDVNVVSNNDKDATYSDMDATIQYHEFDVKEGETATISFTSEKGAPVLCAFELDGVDPVHSIRDAYPVDGEQHFDPAEGLSWTSAGVSPVHGAVKQHRLILGTDYLTVLNAKDDNPQFRANLDASQTTYSLVGDKDGIDNITKSPHMKTWYWRVDEIYDDKTVINGKVMSFEVVRKAFPSAEGYGRYAKAGRGGRIVEVTTLEDYDDTEKTDEEGNPIPPEEPIPGSLRYALEKEKGARVVIFKVGGVIELKRQLVVPNDGGNVYIAGQTAPGDGITLTHFDFGAMGSSDVVIRDIRVRVGDFSGVSTGGMGIAGCDYTIVDHCSISWATDEGFSSRNAKNVTFQWNIIGETLNNSVHYDADDRDKTEPHSFGASISGDKGSFHHNLLINNTGRNWSMAGGVAADNSSYGGNIDIRNNVVYNYRDRTTDGGARRVNFVNNYYKMGALSQEMNIFTIDGNELGINDNQAAYLSGNKYVNNLEDVLLDPEKDDPWEWAVAGVKLGGTTTEADCKSNEEFFKPYVETDTADAAYTKVINATSGAGANRPAYDYIDSRYIREVTENKQTYTGSKDKLLGFVDSQTDAEGYPTNETFKGGEAPTDTDRDGMPDEWETAHGLNPKDRSDGSGLISLSDDGYTNLEMYLNELAGDKVAYSDNPTKVKWRDPTSKPADVEGTGEVDENAGVTASDALAVLRFAAKLDTPTAEQKVAGDTDLDGQLTAADALYILQYAAKLIPSLPVTP